MTEENKPWITFPDNPIPLPPKEQEKFLENVLAGISIHCHEKNGKFILADGSKIKQFPDCVLLAGKTFILESISRWATHEDGSVSVTAEYV